MVGEYRQYGKCEEYIQYDTVKIKHILHTTTLGMSVHMAHTYVRTENLFEGKMSKTSRGWVESIFLEGRGAGVYILSPILISFHDNFTLKLTKFNIYWGGH